MSTPSDVHQHFTHQPPVTGHQPAPPIPEASGGAETTTLLVRHLPEAIPYDMLCRLFSYYGASSVRPCSGASLRNCAFVDFKDETLASHAQAQLNRLRFHKKVLSVERVHSSVSNNMNQQGLKRSLKEASCLSAPPLNDSHSSGSKNSTTLTSGSTRSEPIAPKLGVDYMFPPHLEYDYPPPDGNILTNIVNALIAVPRFYTQVLHLMNKMNIPAPFRMALPTPPLHPPIPAPAPPPPPTSEKPPSNDMSSDESEWESSEEDAVDGMQSRKRAKRKAIVGPGIDKGVAHEDVGLKPASLVPKELPVIKKRHSVLPIKLASKTSHTETRDLASSAAVTATDPSDIMEAKPFATPQEIERGKLPQEEILSLPMFKAYAAGDPNTVLYIKNLAKDVVPDDFYFIFGSLFGSLETARAGLGVKLMQEGRMRGQAFVTFPSIALAQRGLNLVHGYVFKGKPIVIQFGRQSK